jgi:DNA-binding NarL/FixJ family response regulator
MSADDSIATIKILTVDDHPVFREGISAVIAGQNDMALVGEASSGAQAIEGYRLHRPDVTLMDIQMADLDGIATTRMIRDEFPQARIIVLTTYKGDTQAMMALKAGASGYLLKSSLRKELVDAIRAVHAGRKRIPPEIAMQIAEYAGEDALSAREVQILQSVARGNANKEIAIECCISDQTVKTHLASIISKLKAKDRTHAVTIAIKRGILPF